MNNILKHAKATKVVISLSQNKKNITLTISDNGAGFDMDKKRTGIGTDNIKSRAASYYGTADFYFATRQGMCFDCNFSLQEPANAAVESAGVNELSRT